MQTSALEQLASKVIVTIQKKGDRWMVECVTKDDAGFLTDRQSQWGRDLDLVIIELLEKVRNTE